MRDQVSSGNYSVDIDNQSIGNYTYDKIGNLVADAAENISSIEWTVYGKLHKTEKYVGRSFNNVKYGYDAAGNRTHKYSYTIPDGGGLVDEVNTWYIRDAQGNVLAVYSKHDADSLKWKEQHLYGSSRLGMWNPDTTIAANPPMVYEDPVYDSLMLGNNSRETD